jgi:hypothetical protein
MFGAGEKNVSPTVKTRDTQNGVAQTDRSRMDAPQGRLTRRRLLACVPAAALGVAAARPAAALSLEPATAATRDLIANRCSTGHAAYHQELMAELRSRLAEQGVEIDDRTFAADLQQATCPLCGCPLALAQLSIDGRTP